MGQGYPKPCKYPRVKRRHTVSNFHDNIVNNLNPEYPLYYCPEEFILEELPMSSEAALARNCISQDSRLPPSLSSSPSPSSSSAAATTRNSNVHYSTNSTTAAITFDSRNHYPCGNGIYDMNQQQSQELPESLAGCSTYGRGITNMQIHPPNSSGSSRSYYSGGGMHGNHQDMNKRHSHQKRGFPSSTLALYFQNNTSPRFPSNTTSSRKPIFSLGNKNNNNNNNNNSNNTQYMTSGVAASPTTTTTTTTTTMSPWEKANRIDDGAMERMDLLHGILHYILKRNYLVPIHKPRAILDIGTGTGIWVREIATVFPKARVIGLDALDLIRWNNMPKNASFQFANPSHSLPFPDGSFDYVHYRTSYSHILHNGHTPDCRELYRLCRSSGWVEIVELHRRLQNRGPCGERLDNFIAMVLADRGQRVDHIHGLTNELGSAGFIDVTQRVVSLPVGDWGGAPGTLMRRAMEMLMRALADDVVRLASDAIDHSQYEALIDCFLEETERRQTYMEVYCFTGRRP